VQGEGLRINGASPDKVEAAYRSAVGLEPGSPMAWCMYADYLSSLEGRSADALKAVDRACVLVPDYAPALVIRTRLSIGSAQ